MTLADFITTYRGQQRLLVGTVALSAGLALSVAVMSVALLRKEQLVVLVPPALEAETAVGRLEGSRDYLRAWGLFVARTLGDVTPANVRFARIALEPLLSAGIYAEVIGRLEAETDKIARDRLSVSFEPHSVLIEEDRNRVFVTGVSVTEGLLGAATREARTFEMEIVVDRYRPRIDFLNTYPGEPRTADVLARQAAEAAR